MKKVYFKYGMLIAVLLIVYFFILRAFGFHTYTVLSSFNAVIYGFGIYYALITYKKSHKKFKFEKGLEVGLMSGVIATILFLVVMAVYMYQIDTGFASSLLEGWETNYNNGPSVILLCILIMGFSTTFMLTFAFMQLLKTSWNTSKTEKE